MEKPQETKKKPFLGRFEKKIIMYVLLGVLVVFVFKWAFTNMSHTESRVESSVNYDTLRGVVHLVLWQQDFIVTDLSEKSKKYFGWDLLTTKESVSTTASGTMQFYLDLSDRDKTKFVDRGDLLEIHTRLEVDKPNISIGSIRQVKDASLDPTLNVDENAIFQRLDTLAMIQHLPTMIAAVKNASLMQQESVLAQLVGKPVKIIFTDDPPIMKVIQQLQ